MRRRLRKFFPIVLIALTVQIFAPIGACWAASIAASDPAQAAITAVTTPYRQPARVVWRDRAPDLCGSRTGLHAQARAPPQST